MSNEKKIKFSTIFTNKFSKLFLFIFLILKSISTKLIDPNDFNLSAIFPIFIKIEINPLQKDAFIKFQTLDNYKFQYSYKLYISELDTTIYYSNTTYFKNWQFTEENYDSFFQTDQTLWKNWVELLTTNERITKITNLNENSFYRFKYIIFNKYSSSQFSEINFLKTPRMKIKSNHISLYVKGTGRNNHDNSILKLNNQEILVNGLYQGLALIIFDRVDMSVSEISYFDTMNPPANDTISTNFIEYSYNEEKNEVLEVNKEILVPNVNIFPSTLLFRKLSSLTERNMIVLISCYGWEKYFNNELIDILVKFGALNLVEFKTFINLENSKTEKVFSENILKKSFYYHPFAFVGIPNIGGGNGFESIRSNKGHFLTSFNLPFAELLIKIKYNEKSLNYYFDENQFNPDKRIYSDDYDYLFNSNDYSLKNLYDLLIFSNTPTNKNNIFVIYDPNKFTQKFLSKNLIISSKNIYQTQFDIVTFGYDIGSLRIDSEGNQYQDGIELSKLPYYEFYLNVGVNKKDCPPPYNSKISECIGLELFNLKVPILQCKIGLTPQVCITNEMKEFYFSGYKN